MHRNKREVEYSREVAKALLLVSCRGSDYARVTGYTEVGDQTDLSFRVADHSESVGTNGTLGWCVNRQNCSYIPKAPDLGLTLYNQTRATWRPLALAPWPNTRSIET